MSLTISDVPVKSVTPKNLTLNIPPKKKKGQAHAAMVTLSRVYWKEIARGKVKAREIALTQGTVTARQMVNAMIAEGSLIAGAHPEHWVSRVFNSKEWEWTGGLAPGTTTKTQGGERWTKVWKLRGM